MAEVSSPSLFITFPTSAREEPSVAKKEALFLSKLSFSREALDSIRILQSETATR